MIKILIDRNTLGHYKIKQNELLLINSLDNEILHSLFFLHILI